MPDVSVAIPVLNGGRPFAGVLEALRAQTVEHELLVCDSGSSDGSRELAQAYGARILEVAPERFVHGEVRNRLLGAATGAHVALLTQDSEPADERWLSRLLEGFELAPDMGIVYGPYRPRPDAAEPVRIELERWFRSLSPDGGPQVERMAEGERSRPVRELVGRRGFFTDANACLARNAWERVPFRDVRYAEDRVLAIDMLRAGYAKAFLPSAAVIHSHDYGTSERLRRSFDEARGLLEIYGWREPASPARLLSHLRGELAAAHLDLVRQGIQPPRRWAELVAVARHHAVARTGALLGSRADRLPESVRGWLSLEGRSGFTPLELDVAASPATHDNPPR